MSTSSLSKTWHDQPARTGLAGAIATIWQRLLRRLADHRALQHLADIDPRLIRDMGLDPDRVRTASGNWDVHPATEWMHRPTDLRR